MIKKKKLVKKTQMKLRPNAKFSIYGAVSIMVFLILGLTIGYAAMSTTLNISGEASFRAEADIRIIDIKLNESNNGGVILYNPDFTRDTIITGVELPNLDSTVSFDITILNMVNLDKYLQEIININMNNPYITYTLDIAINDIIDGLETRIVNITFHYRDDVLVLPANNNLDSRIQFVFNIHDPLCIVVATGRIGTELQNGATWELCDNGTVLVYGGNITWNAATSPWVSHNNQITRIVFTEPITAGVSIRGLFSGLTNMHTIEGLDNFNTSNVVNMSEMFANANSLTSLDLSTWDTSNVTNMGAMFFFASSLTSLDLTAWDTGNVTNMINMFRNTSSLTSLNVSTWDTSSVTNMRLMFTGVSDLTNLNVQNWNTGNVTSMENMFNGASSLTSLDLTNWNTSSVTDMGSMFNDAHSLVSIGDVSNWNVSNVTTMSRMFQRTAMVSLDLSGWNTSNATEMIAMFSGTNIINSIKLGENFIIGADNISITNVPNNETFTGLWTNVGISAPAGSLTFNGANLVIHIRNNPANERWVWQVR